MSKGILLYKSGPKNFGAALMGLAVHREASKRGFWVGVDLRNSRRALADSIGEELAVIPELYLRRGPRVSQWLNTLPAVIPVQVGPLRRVRDVRAVLDVSGLSYSDHWGRGSIEELWRRARWWKKVGRRTILLPQSFGPFDERRSELMRKAVNYVDQVWVRDAKSYELLNLTLGDNVTLFRCPDFTAALKPNEEVVPSRRGRVLCVVPNVRMLDRGAQSTLYLSFLLEIKKLCIRCGWQLKWLLHSPLEDWEVLARIHIDHTDPSILQPSTPMRAKAVLGGMDLVIGSRFHALVSSLSMGVPSIAIGWAHKYDQLMQDYRVAHFGLTLSDDASLRRAIETTKGLLLNDGERKTLAYRLIGAQESITKQTEAMWDVVFDSI
jgi:hypothetical protein